MQEIERKEDRSYGEDRYFVFREPDQLRKNAQQRYEGCPGAEGNEKCGEGAAHEGAQREKESCEREYLLDPHRLYLQYGAFRKRGLLSM